MYEDHPDRRHEQQLRESVLKRELNEAQLDTFLTLERFGWALKFIRHAPAGSVIVVYDPDKRRFAVIEPDGSLNENPHESFRH